VTARLRPADPLADESLALAAMASASVRRRLALGAPHSRAPALLPPSLASSVTPLPRAAAPRRTLSLHRDGRDGLGGAGREGAGARFM